MTTYALICPNEIVLNRNGSQGYRVAQVENWMLPVAQPYYWLECTEEIIADVYYFDPNTGQILIRPDWD